MIPIFLPVKTRLHIGIGQKYWSASASYRGTNFAAFGETEDVARRRLVRHLEEEIVCGRVKPPALWSGSTVPLDLAYTALVVGVAILMLATGALFYHIINA